MKYSRKYLVAIMCKVILVISSLVISIFLNRGLGVEAKGQYTYIINMVEMFYIIGGIGLGQAYSTFKRKNETEKIKDIFVTLSILQGIFILIIGIIMQKLIKNEYEISIVVLTSLAIIRANLTLIAVIENSIKRNILLTIMNVIYLLSLGILYITNNFSLIIVLVFYGLNELIRILVFIYSYKLSFKINLVSWLKLKEIYKLGILTMIVTLLITINYSIDIIMLKNMTTDYSVGIYSVAVNFSNMFLLIPDAFKEVLFGDSTKKSFSYKIVFSAIKFSLLISLVILLGFLCIGKYIITILYGSNYILSYKVTLIIFIGSLSMIFFKILQPVYISHEKQKKAILFLSISGVMNIFLNLFLIPKYEYYGAAISSAISYTICGSLFFYNYLKNINKNH